MCSPLYSANYQQKVRKKIFYLEKNWNFHGLIIFRIIVEDIKHKEEGCDILNGLNILPHAYLST